MIRISGHLEMAIWSEKNGSWLRDYCQFLASPSVVDKWWSTDEDDGFLVPNHP